MNQRNDPPGDDSGSPENEPPSDERRVVETTAVDVSSSDDEPEDAAETPSGGRTWLSGVIAMLAVIGIFAGAAGAVIVSTRNADDSAAGTQAVVDREPACAPGRVDIIAEDFDVVNDVRGLRDEFLARRVVDRRGRIDTLEDVRDAGVPEPALSRLILSKQACIGSVAPESTLPGAECDSTDTDIATAGVDELMTIPGMTRFSAQLIVDNRPFTEVAAIEAIPEIDPGMIALLALAPTCMSVTATPPGPAPSPPCSERIDLQVASESELATVRGLFQPGVASQVVANRDVITRGSDLLAAGLSVTAYARVLLAHGLCIGDYDLDAEIPGPECAAGQPAVNQLDVLELVDLPGITPALADLIIASRPITNVDSLLVHGNLGEEIIGWLAAAGKCLGPAEPADATPGACPEDRVDLVTLDLDELKTVRGLRDGDLADKVDTASYSTAFELSEIGIDSTTFGKLLAARQTCVGDQLTEDALVGECEPTSVDLNFDNVSVIAGLKGVTVSDADVIIAQRPIVNGAQIAGLPELSPEALTAMLQQKTCAGR